MTMTNTAAPERGEPQRHWRCMGCGEWFDVELTSHAVHAPGCDGSCSRCPIECGPVVPIQQIAAAPRDEDGAHRYDQVLNVLDHYTPAERAEAFYLMESRYCWDCGHPPADCQCAAPPADAVRAAARALADKLEAVVAHPRWLGVFGLAQLHGAEYDGPTFGAERVALRAALDASERADGAA